jgi:hypothetical protein
MFNKNFLYFINLPIIIILLLLNCNLNYDLTASLTEKDDQQSEQSVRYSFFENFENGDISGWQHGVNYSYYTLSFPYVSSLPNGNLPKTLRCLSMSKSTITGDLDGIYRDLGVFRPTYISLYMMFDSTMPNTSGYFVLSTNHTYSDKSIYLNFYYDGTNYYIFINNIYNYPCTIKWWYYIEFRNINWTDHKYDLYIDGVYLGSINFFVNPPNIDFFRYIDIYNTNPNCAIYIDDIYMRL